MYSWSYNHIINGGEKWQLHSTRFPADDTLATVIRLPGTVCRIYYRGGDMVDCNTLAEVWSELKSRLGEVPPIAGG